MAPQRLWGRQRYWHSFVISKKHNTFFRATPAITIVTMVIPSTVSSIILHPIWGSTRVFILSSNYRYMKGDRFSLSRSPLPEQWGSFSRREKFL
jgi:hypothetical protein